MKIAHQPGSQPLTIPERIPNPVTRPLRPIHPQPEPDRNEPVKVPEKVPAKRAPAGTRLMPARSRDLTDASSSKPR